MGMMIKCIHGFHSCKECFYATLMICKVSISLQGECCYLRVYMSISNIKFITPSFFFKKKNDVQDVNKNERLSL